VQGGIGRLDAVEGMFSFVFITTENEAEEDEKVCLVHPLKRFRRVEHYNHLLIFSALSGTCVIEPPYL